MHCARDIERALDVVDFLGDDAVATIAAKALAAAIKHAGIDPEIFEDATIYTDTDTIANAGKIHAVVDEFIEWAHHEPRFVNDALKNMAEYLAGTDFTLIIAVHHRSHGIRVFAIIFNAGHGNPPRVLLEALILLSLVACNGIASAAGIATIDLGNVDTCALCKKLADEIEQ